MPKRTDVPRRHQLLIRLTDRELDVLNSAAHLNRTTANSYAYDLLRAHVAVLEGDPHVARDLANVADFAFQVGKTIKLERPAIADMRETSTETQDAGRSD